jgi:sec-independent protein translocase protein TatA
MVEGIFQPMHLLVILFIALLVFGPKKLPELGRGLGDGIRSFKDSMRNETRDDSAKDDVRKETEVVSVKG